MTRRVRVSPARTALRLLGGLLLLIAIGTLLLWLPQSGARGRLRFGDACFTALSALTTTGLSTIRPALDLSVWGQLVLLVLMQLGSIGFTVLSVVVFMLIGRRITFAERVALRDTLGVFDMRAVGRLAFRVLLGIAAIESLGALLLWLNWSGRFGAGRAAYLAIFHSVSAFSNASFDLFGGGPSVVNPFPTDTATLLTLAAIIACGSFGVPVIYDLLNWRTQPRVTLHTKITLGMWTTLTVLGTALIFTGESLEQSAFTDLPAPRRLLFALFHATASRTAGFNVQPIENLAPASALVLTVLMFIGGAPASTAGGIHTTTLAVLLFAASAYVRGAEQITVGKRAIGAEAVQKAVAIVAVSVLISATGAWLLMITQPATFIEALFEAISAFSTCGFTLGLTSRLNDAGLLIDALLMICGRLGPLTIAFVVARPNRVSLLHVPEESIVVG